MQPFLEQETSSSRSDITVRLSLRNRMGKNDNLRLVCCLDVVACIRQAV